MAVYTLELRQIPFENVDFGNFPIFDEAYREELKQKIYNHYFFDEIGLETVARFNQRLSHTMQIIMPKYNKMYEAELLSIDPLLTFKRDKSITINSSQDVDNVSSIDGTTTLTSDQDTASTTSDLSKNRGKIIDSDLPTDQILDSDIESNKYASQANVSENDAEGSTEATESIDVSTTTVSDNDSVSSTTTTANSTNVEAESGFEQSQFELLKMYRDSLVNIDELVIKELRNLFMLVF